MTESPRRIVQTIIVAPEQQRVLLGLHKVGEFAGYYTGFIGFIEDGEDLETAARSIAKVSCGIVLGEIELRAILKMNVVDKGNADEYEYYCQEFTGEPCETEAVKPGWFAIDEIPYRQMPPDDELWYPLFLRGLQLRGKFHFSTSMDVILSHELEEVDSL